MRMPEQVTGRMVLAAIVGFFAVVIAVNATMAMLAISTFGGVETRNAYQAGVEFSQEIAAARAQQARNWKVEAKVSPWNPEGVSIDLSVKDAAGRPVTDAEFTVILAHPANRREDHVVALDRIGAGAYRGRADVAQGQRDLVVEGIKDDERVFRSKSRIHIR
jgi:nitrogen fixation protein FixH